MMLRFRSITAVAATLLTALAPAGVLQAQDPPVNATLVGTWAGYAGEYAEVWGDGNYAYVGSFTQFDGLQARVHILDITDPSAPTLASTFFLPAPNQSRSPQDVKVANGLLFIGLENSSVPPVDLVSIVDVRDPFNPSQVTTIQVPGFDRCHDTFYDGGFLYVVDSSTPRVAIVDLRALDPDNPPGSPINSALWVLQNVGNVFVHDITVGGGRLYAAAWDSGLWVYDVTDVANTMPAFLGSVGGNNTHAMWPSGDGAFVVTGEERSGGGITVFEITDLGGSITLTERDSLVLSAQATSVHNQAMIGNRLYVSWYQAGLQVFDVNASTGQLEFIASYDTSALANNGGFNGAWGVYPFLGEDKVLISDIEEGFFVISVQGPLLTFDYPGGLVELADPAGGTPVRVTITPGSDDPDPATAQLFARVDAGAFVPTSMTLNQGVFTGQLPAAPCGSNIDYYVSIDTLGGQTVTDPSDAPATTYSALSAIALVDVLSFDFETAPGWTVSGGASDGAWDRGVPVACDRGDPPSDFDASGQCFLTDNSAANGCNSDVDGGTTTLTSPTLDLSGLADPRVRYARWYNNSAGGSPLEDIFEIDISDNDGASWTALEVVGPGGGEVSGGWFERTFRVADFVTPTSQLKLRFSASDLGGGSVVEAGLDAFAIVDLECTAANEPPSVTIDPVSQTTCEGAPVTFDVTVSGTPPFTYQWTFDGQDILGATGDSHSIASVAAADAGAYACRIDNAFGSVTSSDAILTVVLIASCDDTNECTVDTCESAACVHTDVTPAGQCCDPFTGGLTGIDDADACTDDVCNGDGTVNHNDNFNAATECCDSASGTVTVIDDGNACTDDVCNVDGSVTHTGNFNPAVDCCNPADGSLAAIDDGNDCTNDFCDDATGAVSHVALSPQVAAEGGRSIAVTAALCSESVALSVTSPDAPCLSKYVGADGVLSDTPVFQMPGDWSGVHVRGVEVVPETAYTIRAELAGGILSDSVAVTTWVFGDMDNDGQALFEDILLIVAAFQNNFSNVTLEAADIDPCEPDRAISFGDILAGVIAFQNRPYTDTGCPMPCP